MSKSEINSVPEQRPASFEPSGLKNVGTEAIAGDGGGRRRRQLIRTKTPGIYRRVAVGGKLLGYVVVDVGAGQRRQQRTATFTEARQIKSEYDVRRAAQARRFFDAVGRTVSPEAPSFRDYTDEWAQGHGWTVTVETLRRYRRCSRGDWGDPR